MPKADCYCLFDIPQNLFDFIVSKFPKAKVKHNLYPFIESSLKRNHVFSDSRQVHVNFFRDVFEIISLNSSKLVFCNIFNYLTERDILYYVLLIFDQLKLPPDTTELIIHGHLPQVSPVYHLLKRYIRLTSFAKLNTTYQVSYTFAKLPEHYYSVLLNAYKCE